MNTAHQHNANYGELVRSFNQIFIQAVRAYDECDPEIRETIKPLLAHLDDPDLDETEKATIQDTIMEAFFPSIAEEWKCECAAREQNDAARRINAELDAEEATFAANLSRLMREKNVTQTELAAKVGIGQSAISNFLNRDCRPQRRTIEKFAEALGISQDDLWPNG